MAFPDDTIAAAYDTAADALDRAVESVPLPVLRAVQRARTALEAATLALEYIGQKLPDAVVSGSSEDYLDMLEVLQTAESDSDRFDQTE